MNDIYHSTHDRGTCYEKLPGLRVRATRNRQRLRERLSSLLGCGLLAGALGALIVALFVMLLWR